MRARWAAVVSILLLAGCSTTSVTGSPAEKVLTKDELYDPCTLPVASLVALGLDPKPIEIDFFGVPDPEWHLCGWKSSLFYLTVLSTTHTFQEVKDNPRNEQLRDTHVDPRQAITYFDASDPSHFECNIAFPTEAGVVIIRSRVDDYKTNGHDPCDVAQTSATSLSEDLPQ